MANFCQSVAVLMTWRQMSRLAVDMDIHGYGYIHGYFAATPAN